MPAPLELLPPHDVESEAGALGCVLLADGNAAELLAQLRIDHFYDERHRTVYRALKECSPPELVALYARLRDVHASEELLAYVANLPDKGPSPANFPTHFERLEGFRTRRALLSDAADMESAARNLALPVSAIADAARRIGEAYAAEGDCDLPPFIDACEFLSTDQTPPPELVRGILHKGCKLVLGGGSKSFKTWSLIDLGLSVAHGRKWLLFDTAPGRVLYVNLELPQWSIHHRINAVARAKGIDVQPGTFTVLNLRGRLNTFEVLLLKIAQRARKDYALIIIDPIYKIYGRTDENKAGDVARLCNAIDELSVRTETAVSCGNHFSKGNQAGKESIDRISGSGVFARDPDSLLVFTKHEEDGAFTVESTLRNFAPVDPFVVRWEHPLMRVDCGLDPSKLKQATGRKPEHSPEDLLRLLPEDGLKLADWITAAEEQEGISRRTFFRLKETLESGNRILKHPATLLWRPLAQP
jgi:hypothetical protein